MSGAADVVVVGGGLMGLWSALAAARAGRSVALLEAESIGRHASSASAGGVRSLNRHPAEIPLARAALPLWDRAAGELGADVGFQRSGQIRVAEDEAALAELEARHATTTALGHTHEELIGANELRAMEPALAAHCRGALIVRDDGFADPLKTVHALKRACRTAGVVIREGVRVARVAGGPPLTLETSAGPWRGDVVINAAGSWGGAIAEGAGEPVPISPAALQMSVTAPLPPFVSAVIGTAGRKLSLKQGSGGHVVIGGGFKGTVDERARIGRPLPALVGANLNNAVRLFPCLAAARVVRTWAGIEGMTADGLPVLSPSRTTAGLVHAFGFSAHGFALSPLIGRLVLAIIEGNDPGLPIEPFSIDRFRPAMEGRRHA